VRKKLLNQVMVSDRICKYLTCISLSYDKTMHLFVASLFVYIELQHCGKAGTCMCCAKRCQVVCHV